MLFRYPDKPMQVTLDHLATLNDRESWVAEVKWKGWRVVTMIDQETRAYTRSNMRLQRALRRDDDFEPPLREAVRKLALPRGSAVDGEFMSRFEVDELEHEMYLLFDLLYLDYEWIGDWPLHQRRTKLLEIMQRAGPRLDAFEKKRVALVRPAPMDGVEDFYQSTVGRPLVEGLVIKHEDSTLIGDIRRSVENPFWLKVKWRE